MAKYHLKRILTKYGWDAEAKESKRFVIEDKYDPMIWDDVVNNIGYLVEGHKGETITFEIRMEKEGE